ncbi:hypothetical protein DFJ77DRAFT_550548 [Powellomyces hirtus]|nr:hypothetical protein DFJ77DRAFT_550548 [Powellomyces hirtus]
MPAIGRDTWTIRIVRAAAAGRVFSLMPDVGKAKDSASDILALFDTTPPIDNWSDRGTVLARDQVQAEYVELAKMAEETALA